MALYLYSPCMPSWWEAILFCIFFYISNYSLYGISSQLCCSEKNVKLCLCSIKNCTMKTWGSAGRAPHTLPLHFEVRGIYTMTGLLFRWFCVKFLHHAVVKYSDISELSPWKLKPFVPLKCHNILSTTQCRNPKEDSHLINNHRENLKTQA